MNTKYEQLVVGRETFAYEFLFFRFREFELAGAEAQEIRFPADFVNVIQYRTSVFNRHLADEKNTAVFQFVVAWFHN